MHGYQIINEIQERSGGNWRPSAGSIYPTLQLLTDEGLIVHTEDDGKKTYSLTDAGRAAAAERTSERAPWDSPAGHRAELGALRQAGMDLAAAAAQIGRTGDEAQVQRAIEVLTEARRSIYTILAES